MKKILMVNTVEFEQNGITTVCINLCNNIDHSLFQIDLVSINEVDIEIKKRFNNQENIYIFPNRKEKLTKYLKSLFALLRKKKYDVIHIHGNSSTMIFESLIARLCGVKKIIAHCHNNKTSHNLVNKLLKPLFKHSYTCAIACSQAAGNWLFGDGNYTILNNAIKADSFLHNNKERECIRKELQFDQELVLGHVGLFNEQKNHEYMLILLKRLRELKVDAKFLFVGHGELKEAIQNKAIEENINNNIVYLENRNDISSLLSAMDIFVFPSRWEGFGLALLEAQANGLPCFVSDFVTSDVNVTNTLTYLKLDDLDQWVSAIMNLKFNDRHFISQDNIVKIKDNGFDYTSISLALEKIYI